jgi:hypothetical protein
MASCSAWEEYCIIARRGKDIRLISLFAKNPGNGAFRRLVLGIITAGYRPVVVEPLFGMESTMRRWGWSHQQVGRGLSHEDLYIPTKRWMKSVAQSHTIPRTENIA